tara:strand:+ start:862 stop:1179 length:318 start_codon:yes stop_codon:yes gene_type:complete
LFGGCFGLQYLVPSRLFSFRGRLLLFCLLWATWWAFLSFHRAELFLYRELALLLQCLHFLLSLLYFFCFGGESLSLQTSDIKERKIELLREWQRKSAWKKSVLQV